MWQSLLAAFALGLAGSVHCIGMCGPLALALPVQHLGVLQRTLRVGLYHTGRIGVYSLGGLLFGLLGRRVYLAGWQQGLSIVLGVSILGWVAVKGLRGQGRLPAWAGKFYGFLQARMARLWQSPSGGQFLLMGMANGLLPCGMVWLAIAGALTSADIFHAAGFMAFFGLGTLPMLLGLQITGRLVSSSFRQRIRRALPYLTAFMAILLILRGLNLGIPLISPALPVRPGSVVECH